VDTLTWTDLVGEKSDHSFEEIKQLLEEVVQTSDNITVEIVEDKTTITLPNQSQSLPTIEHTTQQTLITPQVNINI
jgi:hypothetical protein